MRLGLGLTRGASAGLGFTATTYTGSRIQSLTTSNFFRNTTEVGPQLGPSQTVVLLVDSYDGSGGGFAASNTNVGLTKGWVLGISGGQWILKIKGASQWFFGPTALKGRMCVAITCTAGGQYRASVNGRAVAAIATATYTPTLAGDRVEIGANPAEGLAFPGAVCEVACINRLASDAELLAWSDVANADNRMVLTSAVTGDASLTMWWRAGLHWDGSASTSVSGGSAPVTFTKQGSPTQATASEKRYVFGDSYYHDSFRSVAAGSGDTARKQRDPFARLRFTTSATRVVLDLVSDTGATAGAGVFSGGTFVAQYAPPVVDGDRWSVEVTLPAGSGKTIDLHEGAQHYSGGSLGTAIQAVREIDEVTITPTAAANPASRLVVYGDSISVGFNAATQTALGWSMLVRGDYPGGVHVIGWGGRQLHNDATDAAARTSFASTLVQAARSSGTKTLWLCIGTNDYGFATWTAASFGTAYADLLDKIHALDPAIAVYCQSPIVRSTETANGVGSTLGDYRTAISDAATARPSFCTYVNGATILALGDLADGTHPSTAGHATYKAAVKTTLGY